MKKVTIKDVAEAAGCSIATVSNALNNVDVLNPKTKMRVLKAAEELNYVPNLNGKSLKTTVTKNLSFITTTIKGPYYPILADAMAKEGQKYGYDFSIYITPTPQTVMNKLLGSQSDGVIVLNKVLVGTQEIRLMEKYDIKAVFLDRLISGQNFDSVVFDSFDSACHSMEYLAKLGHRRIGFIKGAFGAYDAEERYRGYIEVIKKRQLEYDDAIILEGQFEKEVSYKSMKKYLQTHSRDHYPTAFFAANDSSAFGAIKAMKEMGVNVPEDISVIGFDDIEVARYYTPHLTTTRNPIEEQGRLAVQALIDLIEKNEPSKLAVLKGELIIRDSVIPVHE